VIAILGGPTIGNVSLAAGLRRLGADARLVAAREARLAAADVAVGRLDVLPTLDGVEEGLLELLWLERRGVRVVNPARALLAAHDKLRTFRLLQRAGVPQPETRHVTTESELRELDLPFVVKPRFGAWGRDVMRCRSAQELDACLRVVRGRRWFRRHGALAQELLPVRRHDLRILAAGGEVVGAAERRAAEGEWRTNVSLGGTARPAVPGQDACALAVAAAAASTADLVGVDLLRSAQDRLIVLELNGAVDFDETYSLEGRDVYADLAAALALPLPAAVRHG
jgi:RimK family alpha-L-glutamate ligase